MSHSRIRAITFDFWGTLFHDANLELRHRYRLEALCALGGVGEEAADGALRATYAAFYHTHVNEQRTLDHRDGARLSAAHLGLSLDAETAEALAQRYAGALLEYPASPIEAALEAVRAAAARVPVGLISDTGISPGASLRVLLENNGFRPYFTTLTFSDEIGVSKPQRPMFERTAVALGVSPREILHIGDLEPTDIAGIQALGGRGALIAAKNAKYYDSTRAEYRFKSWYEFLDQLEDILA